MAKVTFTRDQLQQFLGNHELIRKFEELAKMASVDNPAQIITLFRLVEEAATAAGLADSKAGAVGDSLSRIAQALEILASRPADEMPRTFSVDYIDFDENPRNADKARRIWWSPAEDTLNIQHTGGVTQQVGQELYGYFANDIGAPVVNGEVIGFDPVAATFVKFIANGTYQSELVIGVATQDIAIGERGRATVWGRVRGIDTTGTPFGEVWAPGDILYVSTTVAGGFTTTKPTAPNLSIPIGLVRIVHAVNGEIAVRPVIEQQLHYGSFIKTIDQTPAAINTAYPITWSSATISNGVSIDGGTPSRIVVANAGLYKFSASFQLTSGSASVKNVYLWFRKNGVDVPSSTMITSLDSATAIRTPSRSLFFSMQAGDYIELMFASDSTAMTIDNIPATAFAPAAPAAILTVNQEQQ